ncbi:MAG: hypothetical protein WCC60_22450 [Ilumatobacteraceae bacterium]
MPTSDGLVAALPTAIDFPPDWTAPSSGPSTDPGPASGPRKGFCGGGDAETRAVAAGMVAYGALPAFVSPDGIYVEVRLYGFPTVDAASSFLTTTVADSAACPGGFSYQLPEGAGDGTYSGLGDEAAVAAGVVWSFVEQLEAVTDPVAGTDQTVRVTWRTEYSTVYADTGYGYTGTRILQFERHGAIVAGIVSSAWNAPFGFSTTGFVPHDLTADETASLADLLRPGIVGRLRSAGLI